MGNRCARCGKTYMRGNLVSHSKQRTHRLFRPNLHKFQGLKYCTKCLRIVKREVAKVSKVPQVSKAEVTQTQNLGNPA